MRASTIVLNSALLWMMWCLSALPVALPLPTVVFLFQLQAVLQAINPYDPTCLVEYPDVQSKVFVSPVVVTGQSLGGGAAGILSEPFDAPIKVLTVLKSDAVTAGSKSVKEGDVLVVGPFLKSRLDYRGCMGSIDSARQYVFFLKEEEGGKKMVSVLPPEEATSGNLELVKNALCPDCAFKPVIEAIFPNQSLREDFYISTLCAARGLPEPTLTWKKNGVVLEVSRLPGLALIYERGTFTMRKRNLVISDSGYYECEAKNVLGTTSRGFHLTVRPHELNELDVATPPPITLCDLTKFNYCLNGGTCYRLVSNVDDAFCQCSKEYTGTRCEVFIIAEFDFQKANLESEEGQCLTMPYIYVGIILTLTSVVLFLTSVGCYWKCLRNNAKKPPPVPTPNIVWPKKDKIVQATPYRNLPMDSLPLMAPPPMMDEGTHLWVEEAPPSEYPNDFDPNDDPMGTRASRRQRLLASLPRIDPLSSPYQRV